MVRKGAGMLLISWGCLEGWVSPRGSALSLGPDKGLLSLLLYCFSAPHPPSGFLPGRDPARRSLRTGWEPRAPQEAAQVRRSPEGRSMWKRVPAPSTALIGAHLHLSTQLRKPQSISR